MKIINKLISIYTGNRIGYKILRSLYISNETYIQRIIRVIEAICILPFIPICNIVTQNEIKGVKNRGGVFRIRNNSVSFFLPDLDFCNGEFIQNRIFLQKDYFEIIYLNKIMPWVKKNGVALDIGANIGNHTLFFAKECQVRKIYCFEPTEKSYNILCRNIELNGLQEKVITMNIALGESSSRGSILYNQNNDSGSNQVEINNSGSIRIEALDNLTIRDTVDFIKIDVEGFEYEVLSGAKRLIERDRPNIFIEIFDENYRRVSKLLELSGYKQEAQFGNNYIFCSRKGEL